MKTRVMFLLAAVFAGSLFAPAVFAQRRGAAVSRPAGGGFQPRVMRTDPRNSPSTPIQPMTNPIAPMMNSPVQPFVNYNNPPSTIATTRRGASFDGRRDGRFDRNVVVVGGGGFYPGYYGGYQSGYGLDPLYYGPVLSPAPIPGQLPYTYPMPLFNPAPVPGQLPNTIPLAPEYAPPPLVEPVEAPPLSAPTVEYFQEPRTMIPTEPLVPIKEVPALGAVRADVDAKYGEPWGVVTIKGKEKVYYRSGLTVVYENGRAAEVQKRN